MLQEKNIQGWGFAEKKSLFRPMKGRNREYQREIYYFSNHPY